MAPKGFVEIDGTNFEEREKSVCMFDGDEYIWFGKFQLEDWPEEGNTGTFMIKEQVAIDKGLV